jgi:putative transposase
MPRKRYTPEEIVAKLRQVEVLTSQGSSNRRHRGDVFSRRKEFGELKTDQVKRIKELEAENLRLRKAVSDLTLDKLILKEAASGNF